MKIPGSVMLMVAVALMMAMGSCTKKYTCQCTLSYAGAPGLPDTTVNEYEIIDKKEAAEKLCKDASFEKNVNGIKIDETCKLY